MWLAREELETGRKTTFGALMCEPEASFDVDRGQGKRGRNVGDCPEREHDADAGSLDQNAGDEWAYKRSKAF
jgi:hypothetical protein